MYDDEFERLFERKHNPLMVISLAVAVKRALEFHEMTSKVLKDINHPRYKDKTTPVSPKPRFRKGRW